MPADIAVCAAAVSDYRPKNKSKTKLKKNEGKLDLIKFEKNPDILDFLAKNNSARPKIVVGFSAETKNIISNALKKIENKYCDLIIANDVSKKDTGFNVDYNAVSIIDKNGIIKNLPKNKKSFIAQKIAKRIVNEFLIDDKNIN